MKIEFKEDFLIIEQQTDDGAIVITKRDKNNLKSFYPKVLNYQQSEEKKYNDLIELRKQQDEQHQKDTEFREKILQTIKENYPEATDLVVEVKTEATE